MSADDFQSKYASVMESMLRSAVAETTKLFETMVDELKTEISRIKKENEDLKARCSEFEKTINKPAVYPRETDTLPGQRDGSEKRDTAVQCDLVHFHTMLVEQGQPSQNYEQQHTDEDMECGFQVQNHIADEEGNSQMTFVPVKLEESHSVCSLPSELKQEEIQHAVVSGPVSSDHAGSLQASVSENERPCIIQECSEYPEEMALASKDEETRVAVEMPCLGVVTSLQGAENQSPVPEQSPDILLATRTNNIEEESEIGLKISETSSLGEFARPEEHQPVPQHDQRDDLAHFQTMLVEQCQKSQTHEQQHTQEIECGLQEHNHFTNGEGSSQMTFVLVKQEESTGVCSLPSELKQEEIQHALALGPLSSDHAGSSQASVSETENEGPCVIQECSEYPEEMALAPKDEETRVAVEVPCLGVATSLQGAENQSHVPEHSLVILHATGTNNIEEESEIGLKILETSSLGECTTSEQHQPVPKDGQRDDTGQHYTDVHCAELQLVESTAVNKKVFCEELKDNVAEGQVSSKPDLPFRRRGRPPKKKKQKGAHQSSLAYLTSDQKPNLPSVRVEGVENSSAVDTVNIFSSKSPQSLLDLHKETIVTSLIQETANTTLEDLRNREVIPFLASGEFLGKSCSSAKQKPSESQQPFMELEKKEVHATSTEVSSASKTLDTPPVESLHSTSILLKEGHTSVSLQDAMLLVEAMNQSHSLPQNMTPTKTQGAPHMGTCETSVETQTPQFPVGTQLKTDKFDVVPQITDATSTNEAQTQIALVIPKEHYALTPSASVTPSSSAAAAQTTQSHPQPGTELVTPSRPPSRTIIIVPRSGFMRLKIAPVSPAQISTHASTAAQNIRLLPTYSIPSLAPGTPSLSSVPQKTIKATASESIPDLLSQSTTISDDQQSGAHPQRILFSRQVSTVASTTHESQKNALTAQQETAEPSDLITLTSPQLTATSQELNISASNKTVFSQKVDNTMEKLESPKQMASASEGINAPTETSSGLKMSAGTVSTSVLPEPLPNAERKRSPVVRLTRLPFPISTEESISMSRLGCSEGPTQEKLSKSPISPLSSNLYSRLAQKCINGAVKACQMSEEPNNNQETESLPSETCTVYNKVTVSEWTQPSTSMVSMPVQVKSGAISKMVEPLAVPTTAGDETPHLSKEIIGKEVQVKQSADIIQLTSITSKDPSHPHLQMTKTQFLAQLAVSPVVQDPNKTSSIGFADARPLNTETSIYDKKSLQGKSLVTRLRSHRKAHTQGRRIETKPIALTEGGATSKRPRKHNLENESPSDENTTREPIPIGSNKLDVVEGISLPNKISSTPSSITPKRSGPFEDGMGPERSISELASVSSRMSKATTDVTTESHKRPRSGRESVGSKNKKSTSVSPRRPSSMNESASIKDSKSTSESPRRAPSNRDGESSNKNSNSVSPRRLSSTNKSASPIKTESTSVNPRSMSGRVSVCTKKKEARSWRPIRSSKIKESVSTKMNKNCAKSRSMSPQRLFTETSSPKTTNSNSACFRTSSSIKSGTSSKMSSNCRSSTSTKDGPNSKQNKRKSRSLSPRGYSITRGSAPTKRQINKTGPPSVECPKMANNGICTKRTADSTPAKKPRLIQDNINPKKNFKVMNAMKLTKAAKAKTIAKMKNSNNPKSQTSLLAKKQAQCEGLKRCKTKAVWIPPTLLAGETPLAGEDRALPVTTEARSDNETLVLPPSACLESPTVRAEPIVSPLQPLSVIGRHLLKNQCGECGCILSSSAALESHVSLHLGHRPFSCTLCGKSFPDSKAWKRHSRVHRNGRIHVCHQCGKGFVYRFGLTKHIQMVHSRIKPFICQICNKGFYTKRDVEIHIRIHTGEKPFHCNLCEKKFTRRVELNVHLRWHNGEKRHWCPYCDKGFLDFNNLKRHKYTHTGEKPHSCPCCSKCFTQSGHLKKHVKNVHKLE